MIWKTENKTWVSSDVIENIQNWIKSYKEECKMNCIDDRMCHSCYYGACMELIDEIEGILKDEGFSNSKHNENI